MSESRGNKLETYSISIDVGGTNLAAHTRNPGLIDLVKITKTCGGKSAQADRACAT
jgi:hypothetical protein